MKKLLVFIFLAVLFILTASALDVKSYQEYIDFSLTRGKTITIPLLIENNQDTDTGDIEFTSTSTWTKFNDKSSHVVPVIYANSQYILPVEISVPGGADLGMHNIEIYASGDIISKINIDVTFSSDIAVELEETLNYLKDATGDITDLKERIIDLQSEIGSLETVMNDQIGEFTENEDYVSQLKTEKENLQNELNSLGEEINEKERENSEITGMMVTGSSISLGVIIAAIVLFFLIRKGLFKKIKNIKPGREASNRDVKDFESKRPRDFAPKH